MIRDIKTKKVKSQEKEQSLFFIYIIIIQILISIQNKMNL